MTSTAKDTEAGGLGKEWEEDDRARPECAKLSETISSEELSDLEVEEGEEKKPPRLESDFYGLFCLKFRVTEGGQAGYSSSWTDTMY